MTTFQSTCIHRTPLDSCFWLFFRISKSVKSIPFDGYLRINKSKVERYWQFFECFTQLLTTAPNQQYKHYNKPWYLLKVNNKDSWATSLISLYVFLVNFEHSNSLFYEFSKPFVVTDFLVQFYRQLIMM